MKLKGIILVVIISLASIMMPFSVYASTQSQIVPTFSSTTSQWNGHLYVTNFSDGTNNQASSTLSFTFDDDYYGIIYFDGYGPSNQHIANYAACFVAGGYGEYRYSYYQNAVINITSVTINIVNVVKPDSSVDLTQIITLLTAIENDTSSIDNVLDTTLAQIRNILSQLIVSNGYLETLTKIKEWNFPLESFYFNYYLLDQYDYVSIRNYDYYTYPVFNFSKNDTILNLYVRSDLTARVIFIFNRNINSQSQFDAFFTLTGQASYTMNNRFPSQSFANANERLTIVQLDIVGNNDNVILTYNNNNSHIDFIPIYCARSDEFSYMSTDFALRFGLSNPLLDDLHIIANGTAQSNSAASDLETSNDQMADDMDDLATIESGYNQQFNNQLQSIDFTSPIQSNAGILPAANFVISIFNGLINNNPFSVLIIIVCILLIGKKVIGK